MKFVLNASGVGCWDFDAIAAMARQAGYDGVELGASADDSQFTSTNVLLSDLKKVRRIFDSAAVQIIALSSPMAIDPGKRAFLQRMKGIIAACRQLGASIVRIHHRIPPSDQLASAADVAAEANVRIVVENMATAQSATEIWTLLEQVANPALGCSLNLVNATLAGQSSYLLAPTLNQKIFYVEAADGRREGGGIVPCKLGEGDVPVRDYLDRLLGIGYGGYMALELRDDAQAVELARDGVWKLRDWARPREATIAGKRRANSAHAKPAV